MNTSLSIRILQCTQLFYLEIIQQSRHTWWGILKRTKEHNFSISSISSGVDGMRGMFWTSVLFSMPLRRVTNSLSLGYFRPTWQKEADFGALTGSYNNPQSHQSNTASRYQIRSSLKSWTRPWESDISAHFIPSSISLLHLYNVLFIRPEYTFSLVPFKASSSRRLSKILLVILSSGSFVL